MSYTEAVLYRQWSERDLRVVPAITLQRCDRCAALIEPDQTEVHDRWHTLSGIGLG